MSTAHTPGGPKRKYVYGQKYKDVETKLAEARANRGLVFDNKLKVGEWLDSWLSDNLKPLVSTNNVAYTSYAVTRISSRTISNQRSAGAS